MCSKSDSLNELAKSHFLSVIIIVARDEVNRYLYQTITANCARELLVNSQYDPFRPVVPTHIYKSISFNQLKIPFFGIS